MGIGFKRVAGSISLALLLLAQPALAQDDGATCDALAASPYDASVPAGTGISFFSIDVATARPACLAAVEADPKDGKRRFQLGRIYDLDEQFDAAFETYQAAADLGYALALNAMGALHDGGYGTEEDPAKAADLYQQAVDAGIVVAMENLGKLYEDGRGVAQDYERAAALYKQSADTGSAYGIGSLGWLTENGWGVAKDELEATRLYRIAADGGVDFAQNNMGLQYTYARGGLEKNADEAFRYFSMAVEQGFAPAYINLALSYRNAAGVEKDLEKAEELLRRAIAEGNEKVQGDARNDLAWMFATEGRGSLEEAEELARQAVEAGGDEANRLDTLAWILHLTDRNKEALPLAEKAVALDGSDALLAEHLAAITAALGK